MLGSIAAPACRARASACAPRARAAARSKLLFAATSMNEDNSSLENSRYQRSLGQVALYSTGALSKAAGAAGTAGSGGSAAHPVASAPNIYPPIAHLAPALTA